MLSPNKPLKIGLVLDDSLDKDDGVQQYVLILGAWLKQNGHDVHYLVGATKRTDLGNVHSLSKNINVRFNGNRMSMPVPSSNVKLRKMLRREKFDVLHIQMPYSPYLAHRIILYAGDQTAIIGTFHIVGNSKIVTHATRLLRLWTSRSLRKFDEIISVSTAAQSYARDTFKRNSVVLPNIINYDKFHDAKPFPKHGTSVRVLFLGRLVPRKGCLQLLKAANELHHNRGINNINMVICGKGPLRKRLDEYVISHRLGDLVDFVGYVSEAEKPRYFASADISVFPSHGGESFGIVLIEAMASGRAAILGGDNVGYHAVLSDRPDLLFDPFSHLELADRIEGLIGNKGLRDEASAWGGSYAKRFDVKTVGPEIVDLYLSALRKR